MRKDIRLFRALLVCVSSLCAVAMVLPVFAGEPPCEDSVRATALRGSIHVYHDQAEWNCCATIAFDLDARGDTFDLYESETFEVGPCDCLCCFDLVATITDVPPGDYLVRVLAAETGEVFGETWVEVPEVRLGVARPVGPRGTPASSSLGGTQECAAELGGALQSPCGGWTADVEVAESTWGRIKTLFR